MFELRAASATACRAVNGGATTISTPLTSFTSFFSSLTNTTASCTVLNIFQLPAMNGILIRTPAPPAFPALFIRKRCHTRQHLTAEEFERCAAAGRDVRDAVGDARFLHCGDRIAAADNRRALDGRHRPRDG